MAGSPLIVLSAWASVVAGAAGSGERHRPPTDAHARDARERGKKEDRVEKFALDNEGPIQGVG
jgi:hypothetical protein